MVARSRTVDIERYKCSICGRLYALPAGDPDLEAVAYEIEHLLTDGCKGRIVPTGELIAQIKDCV